MELSSNFFLRPSPWDRGADVADDSLAALCDVDILHRHLLLAPASVSLERLDLSSERARELVEGRLCPYGGLRLTKCPPRSSEFQKHVVLREQLKDIVVSVQPSFR